MKFKMSLKCNIMYVHWNEKDKVGQKLQSYHLTFSKQKYGKTYEVDIIPKYVNIISKYDKFYLTYMVEQILKIINELLNLYIQAEVES